MANENLLEDANSRNVAGAVTDDASEEIRMLRIDDATKGLKVMLVGGTIGTVTSITASTGLTATPNPIVTTGTIALDSKLAPLDTLGTALQSIRVNAGATALEYYTPSGGTGTVTTVSVASANGFAGTVANATTTPAITISTSITGILKGNATAISAATAGTDYAVGSTGLSGGQTIAGSTLTTENLTLRANAADLTTGAVIITSSKEASSSTVGSVQLAGGLAVAKRVFALDMTVTNTITGSISGNAGTASAVAVGGITGLGTGVATALAVNVGSAGAFVTFNGALGTPSSGVATNITGLPAASVLAGTLGTGAYTMDTTLTVPQIFTTPATITVTSNAGTVTRTHRVNNFTNSSASAMTITLSLTGVADGDMVIVRIYDASAATKGITWVNTENSTVTAPTTSNGSTTLPLTVGFQYNSGSSLWRCLASA